MNWNAAGSAYDVIAAVNQLRAANGLAPYQINGALMAAAQAHSEYQASIGSVTHSGAGGSSPKTRAAAAGYGGGASFSLSENIYGGNSATYQQAVQWWQGDSSHLTTMLSTSYVDAGAGVATNGSTVYFTLDVGAVSGGTGSGAASTSSAGVGATAATFYPAEISTPGPDGSIVHIVQPGQALWNIAALYSVSLAEILRINNYNANPVIHPGDKVIIKTADPNATPLVTDTPTPIPATPTKRPTRTLRPTNQPVTQASPEVGSTREVVDDGREASPIATTDPLLIGIAVLVVGGALLVLVGSLLNRKG
ncbi:MAG: CAP domain-containing protein [Chloroflexota bacterium]